MNMKKTIAAIAAGAVAVSAMATTVSALSDQTLNYNLVSTHKEYNSGNVNIKALFKKVDLSAAAGYGSMVKVTVDLSGFAGHYGHQSSLSVGTNSITCNGIYTADNTRVDPITRSSNINADNYVSTIKDGVLYMTIGVGEDLRPEETDLTITANIDHALQDWCSIQQVNEGIEWSQIKVSYEIGHWEGDDGTGSADGNVKGEYFDAKKDIWVQEVAGTTAAPIETTADTFIKTSPEETKIPFETNSTGNRNVVDRLQADCGYKNVLPVVNDAIANYETVTFAFHTAKEGIKWVVDADTTAGCYYVDVNGDALNDLKWTAKDGNGTLVNQFATREEAVIKANQMKTDSVYGKYITATRIVGVYNNDWNADGSYKTFTQHLYNGMNDAYGAGSSTWGGMGEGYFGFDFGSQNLFGGALVVNENLTMSLSDLDYFVWNADTLSFDWDAIMDGAATSNQYATFVQSLKLATSTMWYWDSMDLALVAGETDSVDTDASVDSDDETLDEEDADSEEITDEEITDEEVTDEEEEEEVTTDEEEEEDTTEEETTDEDTSVDTQVVDNPTTGNAPVALAVIPVALAAAAIVAKKRG